MHRGSQCMLPSVHKNPSRCRDARFRKFHAWSMRTLFSCSKYFRPVVQTLYPHNSLRSLSLHFYVTSGSKRTGRRPCNACADQENENVISSPQANSGRWWRQDPCCFHRRYGFFQPGKKSTKVRVHKSRADGLRLAVVAQPVYTNNLGCLLNNITCLLTWLDDSMTTMS